MAVVKAWAKDDEFRKNHKFEEPTFSVSPPRIWRMLLFIHVLFFSSSFFSTLKGLGMAPAAAGNLLGGCLNLGKTFVKSGLPISTWGKLGNGWKWWKLRILFQNYDYTCWWKLGNFGAWLQYMMFFNDYMVECLRHCGLKWIRVLRSAKRIMSYSCIPSGNRT